MYRDAGRAADAERVALEVRNLLRLADDGHPLLTRALNVIQSGPRADLKPVSAR
jgi:hypothetical protein